MAVAVTVGAIIAGMPSKADALVFAPGDAVLVIYGNDNEGYMNLGNWNTLKTNGGSFDVSSILNATGVSGTNTIQYTVVGNAGSTLVPMWFGNSTDISTWTSTNKNQVSPNTYNTALTNWAGALQAVNGGAGDPSKQIYGKGDSTSFHTYLNPQDNNLLAAAIPGTKRGSADIDSVLYLLERTGAASTLAGVANGFLNSQTQMFTVSAVPIPAAAVLFATGMIGLIGIARRTQRLAV
jgi:hypothetical protein